MDTKVKNMVHNLQQNGEGLRKNGMEATTGLLQKSAKLLKNLNFKDSRTRLITAGAVGIVGAAGLAYYLLRRNNKLA